MTLWCRACFLRPVVEKSLGLLRHWLMKNIISQVSLRLILLQSSNSPTHQITTASYHSQLPTMKFFFPLTFTALLGHFAAVSSETYDSFIWIMNENAPYDACDSAEFALFDSILGGELSRVSEGTIGGETYNSLEQGGKRALKEVTNEDRELCDCPCICAGSQWLCDAYCGGGRRRLRTTRKLSEESLEQTCANTLASLENPGVSDDCLVALQGATCHSQVTAN